MLQFDLRLHIRVNAWHGRVWHVAETTPDSRLQTLNKTNNKKKCINGYRRRQVNANTFAFFLAMRRSLFHSFGVNMQFIVRWNGKNIGMNEGISSKMALFGLPVVVGCVTVFSFFFPVTSFNALLKCYDEVCITLHYRWQPTTRIKSTVKHIECTKSFDIKNPIWMNWNGRIVFCGKRERER